MLLPFFEFRHLAANSPESSVVYERGGEQRSVERVGDYSELAIPPPAPLRRLLAFRPVPADGPQPCIH